MNPLIYPALIVEEAPGEFLVTFPDIPEAVTGGATREEALAEAGDALAAAVEGILAQGREPAPPRSVGAGMVEIALDPAVAARSVLLRVMHNRGLSNAAVARLMGQNEKAVRRILSGQGVSLDQTLRALDAVGIRPALAFP